MLKGDKVSGKLRKMVKLREQAKSCILWSGSMPRSGFKFVQLRFRCSLHLGFSDVDSHLPCPMFSMPIDNRVPQIRLFEHGALVKHEVSIYGINPRVSGHPILSKIRSAPSALSNRISL